MRDSADSVKGAQAPLDSHQGLFVWEGEGTNWDAVYTYALLSQLAYVHQEPELYRPLAKWLGFASIAFNRQQTLGQFGDVPTNMLMMGDQSGVVIVFSGTENESQVLTQIILAVMGPSPSFNGLFVSGAFSLIFQLIIGPVRRFIDLFGRNVPIAFAGHSLGGAMAQLMGVFFRQEGYLVSKVVTFGAPSVGAQGIGMLTEALPSYLFRNDGDPVPYLPPKLTIFGTKDVPFKVATFVYDFFPPRNQLVINADLSVESGPVGVFGGGLRILIFGGVFERYNAFSPLIMATNIAEGARQFSLNYHLVSYYVDRVFRVGLGKQALQDDSGVRAAIRGGILDLRQQGANVTELSRDDVSDLLVRFGAQRFDAAPPIINVVRPNTTLVNVTVETLLHRFPVTETGVVEQSYSSALMVLDGSKPDGLSTPERLGPSRPFWEFRGRDRLLLLKLAQVIDTIVSRDLRILDDVPTSAVSTREPILAGVSDELDAAWHLLRDQIDFLLTLLRVEPE
jgi:hypothetical protein